MTRPVLNNSNEGEQFGEDETFNVTGQIELIKTTI